MTKHEIMSEVDIILEEAKSAVLATADKKGHPHMRWMTPCVLKDRSYALYAVTSSKFDKTKHLRDNSFAEWMIQSISLDKIVTLRGQINLLDNQSLKTEVFETIGPRLSMFWKLSSSQEDLIILETVINEGMFFRPMTGAKSMVKFT